MFDILLTILHYLVDIAFLNRNFEFVMVAEVGLAVSHVHFYLCIPGSL